MVLEHVDFLLEVDEENCALVDNLVCLQQVDNLFVCKHRVYHKLLGFAFISAINFRVFHTSSKIPERTILAISVLLKLGYLS